MATNDFQTFAVGAGANVLSQTDWIALGALGAGFSSGVAPSAACNKAWRQSSIMSSVLAQLIVNNTGQNAVDDGTTSTLLTNLTAAINKIIKTAGFQFSSTTQYLAGAGPLTLTASQVGSFIDLGATYSGDITLPALSAVADGATLYIWSGAAASFNVKCAGADVVFVNGSSVTSIAMGQGDTLVIGKSGPAGAWVAMWGSAQFLSSAVGQSLAPKPVNTSTLGKFGVLTAASGVGLPLPSGGSWAYFAVPYNSSGQASTGSPLPVSGVAAGSTVIGPATAGFFWYGFGWRIQ